jgi:SAM-dependent methyltransferase
MTLCPGELAVRRSAADTRTPTRFFRFCRWPLELLERRVRAAPELFTERARSTRFPIRAIRYWWAHCAIIEEAERAGRPLSVADVGCSSGIMRRYTGAIESTEWTGLDLRIDAKALADVGYARSLECDFDRALPLPDGSMDIVVQLHVIEHLPRPEFAFAELARITRPGGLILVGSPVMPPVLSTLREWQHRSRMRRGLLEKGRHINSMDPWRWRRMARECGLRVETESGAFLARWSGNPLENHAWWLRLNMAWGAAVPSLGGEIYLALRKPAAPGGGVTAAS